MNLTTNHLPPPLLSQHVLLGIIVSVCEGEEPLHVISVIDANNQLIIASKNIYSRPEPNDPTKLLKKDMIVYPLGCSLPRPNL